MKLAKMNMNNLISSMNKHFEPVETKPAVVVKVNNF